MSASAGSLDGGKGRQQRMGARGEDAVYQADGSGCPRSTVTAGQAFVEDGGDVHLARNEGSSPVELNLPRPHGHQGIPHPGDAAEGLPGLSKEPRWPRTIGID